MYYGNGPWCSGNSCSYHNRTYCKNAFQVPSCPIIAAVVDEKSYHQAAMTWGVVPVKNDMLETMDDVFESGVRKAITTRLLKKDDTIVLTGGLPVGIAGTTNVLKVQTL